MLNVYRVIINSYHLLIHSATIMAKYKIIETDKSVTEYISVIADEARRKDMTALVTLMQNATNLQPKMWGAAVIGFRSYHYK